MKKILHLYSDLMDLYGDFFNIKLIEAKGKSIGIDCEITTCQMGQEFSIADYDMVYIGHGKGKNLMYAARDFIKYKEDVLTAIENGTVFLITGNSRLMFGESFEGWDGSEIAGNGLFDYKAEETREVFTCDTVGKLIDEGSLSYGYINRTAHIIGENKHPLFQVIIGCGDDNYQSKFEGNHYKNYFGTWMVGPVLVRNPHLFKMVAKALFGDDYKEIDMTTEEKSLQLTLDEFHKELAKSQ